MNPHMMFEGLDALVKLRSRACKCNDATVSLQSLGASFPAEKGTCDQYSMTTSFRWSLRSFCTYNVNLRNDEKTASAGGAGEEKFEMYASKPAKNVVKTALYLANLR